MENKGTDRIVVAKPVASRPSSSIIRPFADVTGAIEPLDAGPETSAGPIKPKTVRFTPTSNHAPPPVVPSQGDAPRSDIKPTVLYKPLAKVVSKAEASVLANMGNIEPSDRQVKLPARACLEPPLALRIEKPLSSRTQLRSNFHDDLKGLHITASANSSSSLPVEEPRDLPPVASADRPSYDGYNWRKYGQKQVKGSEYPRSYYKCTHPNCQVKKKVERSLDGQIAEIVYKGEHNHAKPRPPKRGSGTAQDITDPPMSSRAIERNEGSDVKAEATNSIRLKGSVPHNSVVDRELTTAGLNPDDSCGLSAEREDGTLRIGIDPDEPRSKRRKTKIQQNGGEINAESPQEPRASGQGSVDTEVRDDGFRWRKYGQKVVKGNPYPRSYYKCTSADCSVRKLVERALDDPAVCITTYEGKHNHEMPIRSMRVSSSEPNLRAYASKEKRPI